jgi:hypothetical protein
MRRSQYMHVDQQAVRQIYSNPGQHVIVSEGTIALVSLLMGLHVLAVIKSLLSWHHQM